MSVTDGLVRVAEVLDACEIASTSEHGGTAIGEGTQASAY